MSDSNRVSMGFAVESGFALPSSLASTAFKSLRFTGESLATNTQVVNSNEIRSDRQIAFVARTGLSAAGDTNFELSYSAFDDLMSAMLLSDVAALAWAAAVTITASDISAAASDNSLNSAGAGFGALAVGRWIKVTGFTGANAPNNGKLAKIVTKTASKITLTGVTLIDDAAGESVTVYAGEYITNGVTLNTFAIQRGYEDIGNDYTVFRGMAIDKFSLNIPHDNIVTGVFGWVGKSESGFTSLQGSGTSAAPQNDVMEGVDNVPIIMEAGATTTLISATLEANNNLRQRMVIGALGPISLGTGTFNLSGSFQAYYSTKTLYDKYTSFTTTSLVFNFTDSGNNRYVVDIPKVKLTGGKRVAGGINTDIIADMTWSAFRDPTEGITCRIVRFPGP